MFFIQSVSIMAFITPTLSPAVSADSMSIPIFRPFSIGEAPRVASTLAGCGMPTCDFTVGGIYMWLRYFSYRRAFVNDTLFIEGVSGKDSSQRAFSVPVGGRLRLVEAVCALRDYCGNVGIPLRFSAVPERMLAPLQVLGAKVTALLPSWADYLYDASALATLSGKKMAKKRNHVNAFMAANPGWTFEPLTPVNAPAALAFMRSLNISPGKGAMAETERLEAAGLLGDYARFPMMESGVLSAPGCGMVAFTVGEVRDGILFVHVEKMRHDVKGAGETVNTLFARYIVERYGVSYINREDDAGDPGLRRAKESYHPLRLLNKYEMILG